MGPAVVLFVWAVIAGVLSILAGTVCAGLAALLTRGVKAGRRQAITLAAFFPAICAGWIGLVVIVLAIVNSAVLGRDFGFGDGWYAPLPDGFTIAMIDVTDSAGFCPTVGDMEVCPAVDYLSGVTRAQLAGPYILGAADDHAGKSYFLYDTRTRLRDDYSSYADLAAAAAVHKITLELRPVVEIYRDYRFTWVDGVGAATALGVPFLAGLAGLAGLLRLRRRRGVAAA